MLKPGLKVTKDINLITIVKENLLYIRFKVSSLILIFL